MALSEGDRDGLRMRRMMKMAGITGGELLVKALLREGVKYVFGIPRGRADHLPGRHPPRGAAERYGVHHDLP